MLVMLMVSLCSSGAGAFDALDLTRPTGNVVNLARSDGGLATMGRKQDLTDERRLA
jgi:hypothetical protein